MEAIGDRIAPVATETAVRYANPTGAWRRLYSLTADQAHHTPHVDLGKTRSDDLGDRLAQLHVAADDLVEHVVGRERILVV